MVNKSSAVRNRALLILAGVALLPALAACGSGGGGGGNTTTTPPPPSSLPQMKFGAKFAASFAASPNSDPVEPAVGDIIDLSLITDPFDVP